jgi:hypothetical protein
MASLELDAAAFNALILAPPNAQFVHAKEDPPPYHPGHRQ